mgnify:CR=1 FL=1
MKPIVIIQARQSSARLPNKVILPINYIPIIEIIYRRVFSKHYKTVVAISIDKSDDLLCSLLKSKKIPYYRGSLKNVKSRFLDICKDYSDQKLVVRLTADNIFPDKHLINEMINYFFKNKKKYLHINQKSKKVPYGLSVELFELSELLNFLPIILSRLGPSSLLFLTNTIFQKSINSLLRSCISPSTPSDNSNTTLLIL